MDLHILLLVGLFCIGYLAIIFEFSIKINKTAVAVCLAVLCWLIFFMHEGEIGHPGEFLSHNLSDVSQIIFFLLIAMTIVELIDSHKGFNLITRYMQTRSKRKMLCTLSLITFFMSAILDNLTTTILMISIARKLVPKLKDRMILLYMIVIAANAGGAWSPIGDVTTTMLWINGQLSTLKMIQMLFLPSLACVIVPLALYWYFSKGKYPVSDLDLHTESTEPGAIMVLFIGMLGLVFVPIFKWWTQMPPFMGALLALAVLWIATDLLHHKHPQRTHLRIPFILTKIDVSSLLFFLGILLTMDALKAAGILHTLGEWTYISLKSEVWIATFIGIVSAILDNMPLVAATMNMYDLAQYPIDSHLWMLIAYAAGTGGSILAIGSAAGIVLMGLEKVSFFAYLKKASLPAFLGFLAGVGVYQLCRIL